MGRSENHDSGKIPFNGDFTFDSNQSLIGSEQYRYLFRQHLDPLHELRSPKPTNSKSGKFVPNRRIEAGWLRLLYRSHEALQTNHAFPQKVRYIEIMLGLFHFHLLCRNLTSPAFQQWSRALFFSFKSEFGHFEAELANLSQAVRGEASLASKQAQKIEYELQAKERTENRKSRALIRKLGEIYDISSERTGSKGLEMQRWRVEAKKTAFLISLSTHDFETSFRSIRRACVQGTCRWICEDPKFAKWMKGGSSSLQLKGKCK